MVTDGYSAYQKIDKENPDITFAGCYAHCRRKFSDVLKGLKGKQKENAKAAVAYQALQQIAAIYHMDNSYSELQPEERLKMRQLTVKPQVEAFYGLPLTTHTSKEQLLRCSLSIIRFYFCCAASCFFNAAISAARSLICESLPAICESLSASCKCISVSCESLSASCECISVSNESLSAS